MLFSGNAQFVLVGLEHVPQDEFIRLIRALEARLRDEIRQCPPEYKRLGKNYRRALDLIKLYLGLKGFRHRRALLRSLRKIPAYSALVSRRAEYSAYLRRARTRVERQLRDVHDLEAEAYATIGYRTATVERKGLREGPKAAATAKREAAAEKERALEGAIDNVIRLGITPAAGIARVINNGLAEYFPNGAPYASKRTMARKVNEIVARRRKAAKQV